ncbi:hypothetical protein ACHMW7_28490 [Aminobacter sp. UC22_36]|uniref:hypothetical protein n=1 Tax=Aminobacter sp. UC22_36 TaxID=3374549 RepID=UPI003757A17F
MIPGLAPSMGAPSTDTLAVIDRLGLSANLKICLDAGNQASYPGGQKWLDLSGNGHDFFLGSSATVAADDPTFTGVIGRKSGNDYFAHDGGDYFLYDTANEAWMQNMHKAGARCSVAGWYRFGDFATINGLAGTSQPTGNVGWRWSMTTTTHQFYVVNGGIDVLNLQVAHGSASGQWLFMAASVDVPNNKSIMCQGPTQTVGTATYTSPSAGNASLVFSVAARGSGDQPLRNGGRSSNFMCWEGRALTEAELRAFYEATRSKYL